MHGGVQGAKHDGHRGGGSLSWWASVHGRLVGALGVWYMLSRLEAGAAVHLLLRGMPRRDAMLTACLIRPPACIRPLLHGPVKALGSPEMLLGAVLALPGRTCLTARTRLPVLLGPELPLLPGLGVLLLLLLLLLMRLLALFGAVTGHGLWLRAWGWLAC